jgi:hypothetical protein
MCLVTFQTCECSRYEMPQILLSDDHLQRKFQTELKIVIGWFHFDFLLSEWLID